MAEKVPLELWEKILVGSDVEDLIRWKIVCKSWQSLISSSRFVEYQLKHFCKNDCDNNELGHRRITCYSDAFIDSCLYRDIYFYRDNCNISFIVGSCNGLVCVCVSSKNVELVVINPLTREEKKLRTPYLRGLGGEIPLGGILRCWGFGYDAKSNDYKVILGFQLKKRTCFHVLTLNSNTWMVIGAVDYLTGLLKTKCGILCGGTLHWFMEHVDKTREVIISLDLSTDELEEIPQPTNKKEYLSDKNHRLGVIKECLCIYSYDLTSFRDSSHEKWVMRNNKWELYNDGDCESKYDIVHHLNLNPLCDYTERFKKWILRDKKLLSHHSFPDGDDCEGKYDDDVYSYDEGKRMSNTHGYYLGASIYVKSLVSPHPRINNKIGRPKTNSKAQEGHGIVHGSGIRKRKSKRSCKHKRPLVFNFK